LGPEWTSGTGATTWGESPHPRLTTSLPPLLLTISFPPSPATQRIHYRYCKNHEKEDVPEWRQYARYKYVFNIAGNCASVRLVRQLRANVVTLLVESGQKLSFSHLLIPFYHYIPVSFAVQRLKTRCAPPHRPEDCIEWPIYTTNLSATFAWMDANPKVIDNIRLQSSAFARRHLSTAAVDDTVFKVLERIGNPI
jgi:hypothetical protein